MLFTHAQHELYEIYKWGMNSSIQINAYIFQALCYQHIRLNRIPIKYTAAIEIVISGTQSMRDLGVYMSDNTLFCVHVTKYAMKHRRLTGWILRTLKREIR